MFRLFYFKNNGDRQLHVNTCNFVQLHKSFNRQIKQEAMARIAHRSFQISASVPQLCRTMASGRFYYKKGGSNRTGITDEVRDLIKNQKSFNNMETWNVGPGIQEPIRLKVKSDEDIDDDQMSDIEYWPHKGEEWPKDYQPSPVLMVQRVKSLKGLPYWHKWNCYLLGLGREMPLSHKVILPNTPYFSKKLYDIKHLIKITPITFPNGIPDKADFRACQIKQNGEFVCHSKLEVEDNLLEDSKDKMLVTKDHYQKEARKHWERPWNTPFGNNNYYRDTTTENPSANDHMNDHSKTVRY